MNYRTTRRRIPEDDILQTVYYFKKIKEMKFIGRQFLILWYKVLRSTFNALGVEYLLLICNEEASQDEASCRLPNITN